MQRFDGVLQVFFYIYASNHNRFTSTVEGFTFRVSGLGFQVQVGYLALGSQVHGFGLRVLGLGLQVESRTVPGKSSLGGLPLCRGLGILKLTKTPLICTVVFHITVWNFFWKGQPNKATLWQRDWSRVLFLGLGFQLKVLSLGFYVWGFRFRVVANCLG